MEKKIYNEKRIRDEVKAFFFNVLHKIQMIYVEKVAIKDFLVATFSTLSWKSSHKSIGYEGKCVDLYIHKKIIIQYLINKYYVLHVWSVKILPSIPYFINCTLYNDQGNFFHFGFGF